MFTDSFDGKRESMKTGVDRSQSPGSAATQLLRRDHLMGPLKD